MGCRALFLLSIVWATTYSISIAPNSENLRKSRQLDFGECCPCPKPEDVARDQLVFHPDTTSVDDCPCKSREPEIEGASSILSPALQMLRPFISSKDVKKEPEPLLKPEVGLASSVLETLKEVTNEEYQDALARDAVRSVAKALETDLPLMQPIDSPGNIINIILNPKDSGNDLEVVPEASHIQETRCIHSPLGSASKYESKKIKPTLFIEPRQSLQTWKRKSNSRNNYLDMDNEASNIQNSLQKPSNGYVFKSLFDKPYQNEFSDITQNDNSLLTNIVRGKFSNSNIDESKTITNVPDLKLSTFVENIKKSIQSNPLLKQLTKKNHSTEIRDENIPVSTSLTEESVLPHKLANPLKSLILKNNENPMKFRNLLKLKDVEIIPAQHTRNLKRINNIETEEKGLIDIDALNASVNEDDTMNDSKECFETANMDTVHSSSNIKNTNVKPDSIDSLQSNVLSNNVNEIIFKTTPPFILTTPKLNLIEKASMNNEDDFFDYKNNSRIEEHSIEVESNNQVSRTLDLHDSKEKDNIPLKESDPCTLKTTINELQSESNSIKDVSLRKTKDKNILPLIKADIIKSFESFKKVNKDMQEKLGQNLHNVLQVVDADNKNIVDNQSNEKYAKTSVINDTNINLNDSGDKEKRITVDDLQKMSDSILNISNLNDKDIIQNYSASNLHLRKVIKPTDCINSKELVQNGRTENDSNLKHSSKRNSTHDSLEEATEENIVNSSLEGSKLLNTNQNNIDSRELGTKYFKSEKLGNSLKNVSNDLNGLDRNKNFDNTLKANNQLSNYSNGMYNNKNKVDMDATDSQIELPQQKFGMNKENLLSSINHINGTITYNESGCLEINSNEMSVQASEPIANRAAFVQPGLRQKEFDKYFKPKHSLSSTLEPYSAKVSSPNTLDRDLLRHYLGDKKTFINPGNIKNTHKENVFNKVDKSILSAFERNKHRDDLISNNLKSSATNSLKNVLDESKITNRIPSNYLYNDVLKNAEDFRKYFSKAHNNLNDKLQELKMDWSDRIRAFNERSGNFDRSTLNRPTNEMRNSFGNSKLKTPTLEFNKKRTDNKLIVQKPNTFANVFNQEILKPLQLNPKSFNEKHISFGKEKSILSMFTTTTKPISIFSVKKPQKKGSMVDSTSKINLSKGRKTLESVSDNKPMKLRDSKTLSSNIKPVAIRKQNIIPRLSKSESHEINQLEHTSVSLERENVILPNRGNNAGTSTRQNLASKSLQLKAEEFSLLSKLLEGLRSNQMISSRNRNDKDIIQHENIQSPSQNIEQTIMPENTLKENTSYKCKMVCVKDEK